MNLQKISFRLPKSLLLFAVTTLELSNHRCILNAIAPLCPRATGSYVEQSRLACLKWWDVKVRGTTYVVQHERRSNDRRDKGEPAD